MGIIDSVIFDWGGVLIEDPTPGLMAYCARALGVPVEVYKRAHRKFDAEFQKGQISEGDFWSRVCAELNRPIPTSESLWGDAFGEAYIEHPEVFALAGALRTKGFKTAILSNTEKAAMSLFDRRGYDMFDVVVFSCAVGAAKPERLVYATALERLETGPERAVFIDDKPEYVQGATEAGLEGIVFATFDQMRQDLARLGVRAD